MARIAIYLCIFVLHYQSVLSLELGSTLRQPRIIACKTRRDLLIGATAAASLIRASSAMALETPSPKVTALVTLNLSIARGPPSPLRIELFGDEVPASVEFFSNLASGTLRAQCAENVEACEEYQGIDVGYKGSQLWRLVPNKRIDFGRVDRMFASRIPPTFSAEQNNGSLMKASSRGAVSVKRGGGAFEFTVTPAYNQALDKEDLVVVGRIAEGDLAFLDTINSITTRKDIVSIGNVPPLGANFARACDFTAPDPTCNQFKPLKKIIITEASVISQR